MAITDELLSQLGLPDKTWHAARQTLTERWVIEMCLLVGHCQGLASATGGLGIQLEEGA